MARVTEHQAQIGSSLIAWREAPYEGVPVVYVHGVPDSGEVWDGLLARTGGLAIDLPGFGRSAKPADGPYSIQGLGAAIEGWLDHLDVHRFSLVLHDWGAVGLDLAQRSPERVERLVLADVVPFLPGYRWHLIARQWRRPVLGEVLMGATTRFGMKRVMRRDDAAVDAVMRHFDHGTQRAILKLYRASGPDVLAGAGLDLDRITAPALIVWGERDPYLSPGLAARLAQALGTPSPEVEVVPGAGHWAATDDPAVGERIARFLTA